MSRATAELATDRTAQINITIQNAKYKCFPNRFLDGRPRRGTEAIGHRQTGDLNFVRMNRLPDAGRQREVNQAAIQAPAALKSYEPITG